MKNAAGKMANALVLAVEAQAKNAKGALKYALLKH